MSDRNVSQGDGRRIITLEADDTALVFQGDGQLRLASAIADAHTRRLVDSAYWPARVAFLVSDPRAAALLAQLDNLVEQIGDLGALHVRGDAQS